MNENRTITAEYLRENPNLIFVFGDNLNRVGHGGAAALRDEPNTYGFITKKSIPECYTVDEYCEVLQSELTKLLAEINANPNKTYLISRLGAGLANDHRIWEKLIRAELIAKLKHLPNVQLLFDTEPVLVMRTCLADMRASENYGHFSWPDSGYVEAPDWKEVAQCGHGLHGLLFGRGDGELLCWDKDAKWLIVEVFVDDGMVDLGGKIKFRCGNVVHCGDRQSAPKYLQERGHNDRVVAATVTGGNESTVTGGDESTVTGGDESTVTGGDKSTVTGGDKSTVTGGRESTVTGGWESTVTGGNESTVSGGWNSTVSGGNESTVTGGNESTVTGGWESTVTGGNESTVIGGWKSTVSGGNDSIIVIKYYDGSKWRRKIGVVGENGIKPNTKYRLNDAHEFEEDYR